VVYKKTLFPIDDFSFFFHKKIHSPALKVPPLSHLTSSTHTKCNLYLVTSLATIVSDPDLYRILKFYVPNLMSLLHYFRLYQIISPGPRHMYPSRNKASFYGEDLLALRPTSKRKNHPLSAVRECLFNIFAAPPKLEADPPSAT